MDYKEYFLKARANYPFESPTEESFYNNPVRLLQVQDIFSAGYLKNCNNISLQVKRDFDKLEDDPKNSENGLIVHPNIFKFKEELEAICGELVPYLEKTHYGCYLFVDKVYIYRTVEIEDRTSSYIWHYDNNPDEIVKNIIYLSEVNESNSPFEYLQNTDGNGVIFHGTRKGPSSWGSAPNGSRVNKEVKKLIQEQNYSSCKVAGSIGTTTTFCSNSAHRANPRIDNSLVRDVLNIRVKPTMEKEAKYVDEAWTTSYEYTGVVTIDPTDRGPYRG